MQPNSVASGYCSSWWQILESFLWSWFYNQEECKSCRVRKAPTQISEKKSLGCQAVCLEEDNAWCCECETKNVVETPETWRSQGHGTSAPQSCRWWVADQPKKEAMWATTTSNTMVLEPYRPFKAYISSRFVLHVKHKSFSSTWFQSSFGPIAFQLSVFPLWNRNVYPVPL